MANILDKVSEKFDYNGLKKLKDISYYSALGMSWASILTPLEVDLVLYPVEILFLILVLNLNADKTKDVRNIREMYDEVISDYVKMINVLGLQNPVEVSAFFERCYRDGILSRNKRFVFDTSNVRDVHSLFGSNIINGEGVCRHIASMLNDIYISMGIDSNVLLVHMRNRTLVPSVDMTKQGLTKEELYEFIDMTSISTEERKIAKEVVDEFIECIGEHLTIDVVLSKVKGRPHANHAINLVINDGKAFCLDPTNACSLKLNRQDPRFLVDMVDPKIFIDWPGYGYSKTSMKETKKAKKDILLPSTSFEEDLATRKKIQLLYEDNLDVVDYFYRKHNEEYKEISNEMVKIKAKSKK